MVPGSVPVMNEEQGSQAVAGGAAGGASEGSGGHGGAAAGGRSARPDTSTDAGRRSFIGILNQRLPRKRAIAQGLVRNPAGEMLLCELTYKKEWDLPGGVVDPSESPATCVEREVFEELGLEVRAGALLAVNWLPPYRGWDDAVLFLFDLGVIESGVLDPSRFLRREIKGVHWRSVADASAHIAPYAARLLEAAAGAEHTAYLEDGVPRPGTGASDGHPPGVARRQPASGGER